MNGKCRNCGADYGLHHYKTMQCPISGKESPIGVKQEYQASVFEPGITYDELLKQRDALLEATKWLYGQWLAYADQRYLTPDEKKRKEQAKAAIKKAEEK